MKRLILLPFCFLLLMVLVGCSWAGINTAQTQDALQPLPAAMYSGEPEFSPAVTLSGGVDLPAFSSVEVRPQCPPAWGVSFLLPAGWEYEVLQTDDEPTGSMSIYIRPEDAGGKGAISLHCSEGVFGVCGTGLEQKDIVFNGHEAWQGFYDGSTTWNFICLKDHTGCAVTNSAGSWYEDHQGEIDRILATVDFVYDDGRSS